MKPIPITIGGVQVAEFTSVSWDTDPLFPQSTTTPELETISISCKCVVPTPDGFFEMFRPKGPPPGFIVKHSDGIEMLFQRAEWGKLRRARKGGVEQTVSLYRNWPGPKPRRASWQEKRARRRAKAAERRARLRLCRAAHRTEHVERHLMKQIVKSAQR